MALATMIQKLAAARKAYDDQLEALGKEAAALVAAEFAPLIPPGHVLAWRQYTPYFNDGDACTFSVHDAYLIRVDEGVDVDDALSDDIGISLDGDAVEKYGQPDKVRTYETTDYSKPVYGIAGRIGWDGARGAPTSYGTKTVEYTVRGIPAIEGYSADKLRQLVEVWDAMPADMMEKAFGDHARVVVRCDGTYSVDEYDHD